MHEKYILINMKHTLSKIFLLISLIAIGTANAELYKGVDAEGDVEYSDKPFSDAEKYEAPPISAVETPHEKNKKILSEEAENKNSNKHTEHKYKNFHIVSPKDKQSIWNDPELAVSLHLDPALNFKKKHTIWLLLDGEALERNSQSLSIPTGRLERGEHKLQAQIRDSKGLLVTHTKPIVIYIHYGSAH